MANYDSIDTDWTWDGDYEVGDNGDLKDTSYDYIQSLINEVRTVVRSEYDDWQLHTMLGSNLSDFLGEPNNETVAKAIEERIVSAIATAGILDASDLRVRVTPVQNHIVLVTLTISAEATSKNSLVIGDPVIVSLVYDSLEDSIFFLPVNEVERLGR